eukprot:CAMPEP_0184463722 /NCGR_PEP_ID=MMETSP0740-20130409/53769_1 /TAXON_ID=385413 /ORGANISM="Thalassiosira miniscula, Strain CCMP1093" /LENGTH=46 /DNA_ID= /DNA_START= /DNA_END= /DNA_ORIENTATION=
MRNDRHLESLGNGVDLLGRRDAPHPVGVILQNAHGFLLDQVFAADY